MGRDLAQGASTPSLGLSNKAVYQGRSYSHGYLYIMRYSGEKETPVEEKHVKDQFPDHYFTAEEVDRPPPEESLVQNTLWPEEHNRQMSKKRECGTIASQATANSVQRRKNGNNGV